MAIGGSLLCIRPPETAHYVVKETPLPWVDFLRYCTLVMDILYKGLNHFCRSKLQKMRKKKAVVVICMGGGIISVRLKHL